MHLLSALFAIDPSLGKVDRASLPLQALMELLISGITNKDVICRNSESPADISEWEGVSFDGTGIDSISWSLLEFLELCGSLDLQWLPPTLIDIFVVKQELRGSLDLTDLPRTLVNLEMQENQFSGTICLKHLPQTLRKMNIGNNHLSGSLDLTNLPELMKELHLNNNAFEGSINLTKLPKTLLSLYLHHNPLEGETDFRTLPDSLFTFFVHYTNLSGTLAISRSRNMQVLVFGSKVQLATSE
mmetsp:Transcript_15506/g.24242  ORF Transcript_15506/g.24242 Transcript_15506/m.24242 type:complete len:243 (-) Transcript_15506:40-768(-)